MKLFATRVWGFGFARLPLATFRVKGNVDRLLNLAKRGDRLFFCRNANRAHCPRASGSHPRNGRNRFRAAAHA